MKLNISLLSLMLAVPLPSQLRYSTGGVNNYPAATCGGPNLSLCVAEARDFQAWFNFAGFSNVTHWENGDVWGSDFREPTDLDPSGGSDIAQAYFFSGHGSARTLQRQAVAISLSPAETLANLM